MSVFKKGKIYWCNFVLKGKRYRFSTKLTEEREASRFERDKVAELQGEQVIAPLLAKIKAIQAGSETTFDRALECSLFAQYSPSVRRRSVKSGANGRHTAPTLDIRSSTSQPLRTQSAISRSRTAGCQDARSTVPKDFIRETFSSDGNIA